MRKSLLIASSIGMLSAITTVTALGTTKGTTSSSRNKTNLAQKVIMQEAKQVYSKNEILTYDDDHDGNGVTFGFVWPCIPTYQMWDGEDL